MVVMSVLEIEICLDLEMVIETVMASIQFDPRLTNASKLTHS